MVRRISQCVLNFPAQRAKLLAAAIVQDGLCDAQGPAESGDDASHGGNFDLRSGVADEIHVAIADAAAHRNPFAVDRDARALPFERLEILFFKEALEAALCVAALSPMTPRAPRSAFSGTSQ